MFGYFKNRRRKKVLAIPFNPQWLDILRKYFPYYALLDEAEKEALQAAIKIFLSEKKITGCAGLEITDTMRVLIAAQACLLLLNRKTDYYPHLKTILVYPKSYQVKVKRPMPGGYLSERIETRLGESWTRGQVVLSWAGVKHGALDMDDGQNLVYHEFAHQLDDEIDPGDGAPDLGRRSRFIQWANVLGKEFQALQEDIENRQKTLIDAYGATKPAEFFAVVTEAFFERPIDLKERHPELYAQFVSYFNQDPALRLLETQKKKGEEER